MKGREGEREKEREGGRERENGDSNKTTWQHDRPPQHHLRQNANLNL